MTLVAKHVMSVLLNLKKDRHHQDMYRLVSVNVGLTQLAPAEEKHTQTQMWVVTPSVVLLPKNSLLLITQGIKCT